MSKSYTLFTNSTDADNYCSAMLQVVENTSNVCVIERTIDTSTKELAVSNLRELLIELQSQLVKGEQMTLEIVELGQQVFQ
jgi:hypothetical protein